MNFQEYLEARRADIETALASVLPPSPDCPPVVGDAMRYSLTAGGKRLRPVLCLASADASAAIARSPCPPRAPSSSFTPIP